MIGQLAANEELIHRVISRK